MNHFWLNDDTALAGARQPQTNESPIQILGEEAQPDAAFFVDSWTLGVAAASENLLRRQARSKSREHEVPSWYTFSSFAPWFVPRVDASVGASWSHREAAAYEDAVADLRPSRDEEGNHSQSGDDLETAGSLTIDSARKILRVAATSSREQLKAAYRKMASRHHPDRLAQSGACEQKLAGDRMASINEAYRLLSSGLAADRL